jgi:hypothetical protein
MKWVTTIRCASRVLSATGHLHSLGLIPNYGGLSSPESTRPRFTRRALLLEPARSEWVHLDGGIRPVHRLTPPRANDAGLPSRFGDTLSRDGVGTLGPNLPLPRFVDMR